MDMRAIRSLIVVGVALVAACTTGQPEAPGPTPSPTPPPELVMTFYGGWGASGQLRIWTDPEGLHDAVLQLEARGLAGSFTVSNTGTLTPRGMRRVAALTAALPRYRLRAVYPGCGAGCDGFTAVLQVGPSMELFDTPQPQIQVIYAHGELERAPEELRELDRLLWRTWSALAACRATPVLTPNAACTPAPGYD